MKNKLIKLLEAAQWPSTGPLREKAIAMLRKLRAETTVIDTEAPPTSMRIALWKVLNAAKDHKQPRLWTNRYIEFGSLAQAAAVARERFLAIDDHPWDEQENALVDLAAAVINAIAKIEEDATDEIIRQDSEEKHSR